ncbi:MAG: (2Fe-2S)-binding protein, partial [Desulfobacterales bacterium]|nr:(2Fe-2S)-binding protein [Desulfobacterales bacterium]
MTTNRITLHPVLEVQEKESTPFYWNKTKMYANRGEVISSALFANNVKIFGHHHKDGSAQGIFCANGQCAKCTVIANGIPVKACMTRVTENMIVE